MGELIGIVLAGGRGTRFEDGNKLLATVDGDPIVSHAARSLDVDSVDHTIAVLGHDADAVEKVVAAHVDETTYNPEYARGQSQSVRLGARAASERDADAAIFLPGDMPCVDETTVERLVEAYRDGRHDVVVPTSDGQRGNPVLFDAAQFDTLQELSGDTGGRAVFETADVHRIAVDDPGVHLDVDTVADRERLRQSDCVG
ncbi:nucleotidyltransferase family protein [Natronococcus pandeyae]|uniref:Nucleotidyltransferase family protein n=1 Tax=Natronococcus pandeyae TaxID=2055836 RepID=A0A8J8TQK1_9EURY|nr:nucleotidyltransferase family protein [Natronococcus pandeyae]TYL36985.1 nucleotidyltransferase family protein [Natronococcus pandeyae]